MSIPTTQHLSKRPLSDSRSVNRCAHGPLASTFPINVTVPFQAIIIWRDELNEGKVFLRDIDRKSVV